MFAACHRCLSLLCWKNFNEYDNCDLHKHFEVPMLVENVLELPEDFPVYGGEEIHKPPKSSRKTKKKIAQCLRTSGKEYTSPKTNNRGNQNQSVILITVRSLARIVTNSMLSQDLTFLSFYGLGNLQLQREYITKHFETGETKQKTTARDSRRSKSNKYFLTLNNQKILVCKTFFKIS